MYKFYARADKRNKKSSKRKKKKAIVQYYSFLKEKYISLRTECRILIITVYRNLRKNMKILRFLLLVSTKHCFLVPHC